MTVPNGPLDTATFGFSNITNIYISADTEVNGIVFTANATNSYVISFDVENEFLGPDADHQRVRYYKQFGYHTVY